MILRCLFIIRKSTYDRQMDGTMPELIVAWDESSIEENPEGFEEACEDELKACESDVKVSRLVDVGVSADKIRDLLLDSPTITGEVNG